MLTGKFKPKITRVMEILDERKKALLSQIIKQHIHSALPVGSKILAQCKDLNCSSATIRNEMSQLETEGYISHPHISAGRLPTAKGYRFYLDNLIGSSELALKEQQLLKNFVNTLKGEQLEPMIKSLAKKLAELSQNTIVVGFSPYDFYYTGIANLFIQPEFNDQACLYNLSLTIDHLDKVMADLFKEVEEVSVRIGAGNPFSEECSVILTSWHFKNRRGILGILGPMRMDYQHNLGLINFIKENI